MGRPHYEETRKLMGEKRIGMDPESHQVSRYFRRTAGPIGVSLGEAPHQCR